jgi:hypothetical protein
VQKTVDAFAIRIDILLGDMIGRGCAMHFLHLLILLPGGGAAVFRRYYFRSSPAVDQILNAAAPNPTLFLSCWLGILLSYCVADK